MSSDETHLHKPEPVYRASKSGVPQELRSAPFYFLSALLVFILWQLAAVLMSESARRFLVPPPAAVAGRLLRLLQDGSLWHHARITLTEMGLGLVVGTVFAALLGYAVAHSRLVAYILEPIIVISQAVPIVALAPLLTVWFGPGIVSKVVVCALIVFFPILVNITTGLKSIDPRLRDLFRLLEAHRAQVLLHLEIPAALPAFLAGLKVGGTLSAMGAVVGEFVASTEGLGYLVKQGQNLYDLPMMFVAILVLMLIATAVYALLTLLERILLRWQRAGA
ncbi:MAG: ABC transporter permease [Anaerolineae bacterium]